MKPQTWFRFYNEVVDDPKVQRLAPPLFKSWVNFMCIASKHGGVLPEIQDIAYRLRVTPMRAGAMLDQLVYAGLFEWTDGVAHPHNWNGRQFQSDVSTDRVKRFRNGQRNVSGTASETPAPDTEQSRTETEQKPPKPPRVPVYSASFEGFWGLSTKRGSKLEASKAFEKIKPDADLMAVILAAMRDWMQSEQWQDETKQPHVSTWLNRRGWEEIVPRSRATSARPGLAL